MIPSQCRAGRALVNLSLDGLAGLAALPTARVWDFEAGHGKLEPKDIDALREAPERAGVEFLDGNRPGVRFRQPVER
jgi:hypothetical protein